MVDTKKIKALMVENDYTRQTLAKEIGITARSLGGRLRGESSFTLNEAQNLIRVLHIDNPSEIFFCEQ